MFPHHESGDDAAAISSKWVTFARLTADWLSRTNDL